MNSTEESSCASPEASIEPSIAKRFIELTPNLSSLLALAIADLGRVQSDPRYVLDMNCWHLPSTTGCHICLAGAVMAKTLNLPHDRDLAPVDFDPDLTGRLEALDHLREGHLEKAIATFGGHPAPCSTPPFPLIQALETREAEDPKPLIELMKWLQAHNL